MQFKEIIGQQAVKSQLANLVYQGRLSHALLFLGKEGSGALPLALSFAQYIVCISSKLSGANEPTLFGDISLNPQENVSDRADSCGVCAACIKANQLIHPDIHFSFPVITKKSGEVPISADYVTKWREFVLSYPYGNVYDWLQFIAAENKQGNITTRECEDINHKLSLKSFESQYKILIMWMPEFLGKEGNKLLKLIEEPPPDTIFIFVAEDEDAILPTILSRTQLIKIPFLSIQEIADALIVDGVSEAKAKQIAGICEGNYREALQMLQDSEEDWHSKVRDWLNAIIKTGPIAQVRWIEEMGKLGREKQKQFLKYFIHLLQNAVKLKIHEGSYLQNTQITNHVTEKDLDFITRINKLCRLESLDAIVSELEKANLYIERNANAKMLFHALTIRIYHIIKDNSLILIN